MKRGVRIKKSVSGSRYGEKTGDDIPTAPKDGGVQGPGRTGTPGEAAPGDLAGVPSGRIAAYARVSTQRQENDETVNSQIAAIKEFLKSSCQEVAAEHIYVDEGFSGGALTRPGLDKLRDAVAMRRYERVVVLDPDRLARKYVYQMLLVEEFERHGCLFDFIRRPIGKTPDEALLLQMQGVIAEYERAKIADRTRRGKLHRMREGELITGKRTFGYLYVRKGQDVPAHYEVLEEEAAVVRNIFEWYTSEGLCMRDVAARLNEGSVPTVHGGQWHASAIGKVLGNTMYAGIRHAHRYEMVVPKKRYATSSAYRKYDKGSSRVRERSEWISSPCPRIIDDETFELAQARFARNKSLAARNAVREYLLRGLVFCPSCKRRMQAQSGQRMKYFCAFTAKAAAQNSGLPPCDNKVKFPVEELDSLVWKEVVKLVKKPSNLEAYFRRRSGTIVPKATQGVERLKEKIADLREQTRRLNSLFIQCLIDKDEHGERYRILSDKIHMLQAQLDKSGKDCLDEFEIQAMLSSFSKFSQSVKTQIKDADFTTRRFITEQLVNRVILSEKDVTIELAAPLDKKVLRTPIAHQGVRGQLWRDPQHADAQADHLC